MNKNRTNENGANENRANQNKSITSKLVSNGADYAEYFETEDGKPIPAGYSVCLTENGKVRISDQENDCPIGIISKMNSVIADAHEDEWQGKYLRDPFGEYIYEEIEEKIGEAELREKIQKQTDHLEHEQSIWWLACDEEGELNAVHHRFEEALQQLPTRLIRKPRLNPDYDPNREYLPRSQRTEWVAVGLLGKIPLRKGQSVGKNWFQIKELTKEVDLWLVK